MASRLLRRSGVAVGLVCECLGWRADTVIQAGVGYHHQEVDVLKAEWPGLRWCGVDPHPGIIEDARKEGLYDLLIEAAAGDRPGRAPFHIKRHHGDGSSLCRPIGDDLQVREVAVNTLDAMFIEGDLSVDFGRLLLWFDCEGHELAAIRGARELLRRASVVNVEMTGKPPCVGDGWCTPLSIHVKLLQGGFRRQWVHTNRVFSGQYDAIYVKPELWRQEFCCDPC